MRIELFYDKDCPFCNSYASYVKVKKEHELKLLNAREAKVQIKILREKGFDINNGFIIRVDGNSFYQGAEAIIFLNNISQKKLFFRNNYIFKDILYPLIKLFRKLVLFLLGKKSEI